MDWLNAVILGIVEGLTEFIPVSSTAHLILTRDLLGLGSDWDTFIVLIQLGAILAVVAAYTGRFWTIAKRLPTDPGARKFVISVAVAFLPAAVAGVALHDFIKAVLFESPKLIFASLLVGGIVLLLIDRRDGHYKDATAVPLPRAFGIGVVQCLSLVPGVSRSGATIVGGLLLGLDKRAAAEFSFFLAIPTMAGAFAYDLYKSGASLSAHQTGLIAVGFVTAFVSGLFVVRTMLSFVARHGFGVFAWWRIILGAGGLAWIAVFGGGLR
jgi:undecaprenyl-diphosphatase